MKSEGGNDMAEDQPARPGFPTYRTWGKSVRYFVELPPEQWAEVAAWLESQKDGDAAA